MVQAALYQLVLDRKVGGYEIPEGASLIACGTRLRREIGEFLVGSCIRHDRDLQRSPTFIRWPAARTR